MIKPENIVKKEVASGYYGIKCERCGRTYYRRRIAKNMSPICGVCCGEDEAKKAKERAERKRAAIYQQGYKDGYTAALSEINGEDDGK